MYDIETIENIITVLKIFVFCVGCIIGSFLNVVILRAFSGESIVLPPSKCPKCENKLKWWHNIPILSYLILRGKCFFCHEKISIQYPIVEFITGVVFVLVFVNHGISVETIFALIFASLLIVISMTDIKEKVVFDSHTYSLIATGLIFNIFLTGSAVLSQMNTFTGFKITPDWCLHNPLTQSILGLILGVVIMEVAARIGYLLAGNRAFGEGDTYIAAGLGAMFGWELIIKIIIMSILIQIIFTLPLYLFKLIKNKNWKTFSSLSLFVVYAATHFLIETKTSVFENYSLLICSVVLLASLGLYACYQVIRGLKDRETLTYLPFGPALAIAGLIILVTMNFSLQI